jgi:hypothetical protein
VPFPLAVELDGVGSVERVDCNNRKKLTNELHVLLCYSLESVLCGARQLNP